MIVTWGPHTHAGARMPPSLTAVSLNFTIRRNVSSHHRDANVTVRTTVQLIDDLSRIPAYRICTGTRICVYWARRVGRTDTSTSIRMEVVWNAQYTCINNTLELVVYELEMG